MTDWHFGYQFFTPIVGESNYQSALKKCFKDKDAFKQGNSSFVDVNLVFEPNNPYDKNAVAVISSYGTLGYLSKGDAIRYRHLCEGKRDTLSVRCKIYSGSKNIFGAWVDLDLEDFKSSPQSLRKYKEMPDPDASLATTAPSTPPVVTRQPSPQGISVPKMLVVAVILLIFLSWIF
ncbi:HIRAN domain-containing protein [Psychrobacter arenosus]|uniref:HIRAN domain-containing protein n=1 Tax=Psychrobacter arenosus TaxID=256326 RepID=UPI001917F865|nr:HIRAN domain-containing protein [Psychrobacter arenosus]